MIAVRSKKLEQNMISNKPYTIKFWIVPEDLPTMPQGLEREVLFPNDLRNPLELECLDTQIHGNSDPKHGR